MPWGRMPAASSSHCPYGRYVGMTAAAFLVLKMHLEIEALPWSYAVGWVAMLAYEVPALVKFLKSDEL